MRPEVQEEGVQVLASSQVQRRSAAAGRGQVRYQVENRHAASSGSELDGAVPEPGPPELEPSPFGCSIDTIVLPFRSAKVVGASGGAHGDRDLSTTVAHPGDGAGVVGHRDASGRDTGSGNRDN